ncbi:MAG: hypothetical protein FD169_2152 [Bacillota bacterium]|nr:MAG: hypothetical protein FD169_2152 [Bacillota bacterium]
MWDDIEEKRVDRPYLWIVFLLLLLLLSSIFFLRPSVGTIPTGTMPSTKIAPVVTNIGTIPSAGSPIYVGEGATGIWGVYKDIDRAHISFFNALGDEQWAESILVSEALVASSGNYLAIASLGKSQIALYHGRHQSVHVTSMPGEITAISVSEMGEILVVLTAPEKDPLILRTYAALYSSSGQELWKKPIDSFLPIACKQSADGTTNVVLGLGLDSKVQGELVVFGRLGELLCSTQIAERPVGLTVRADGERIAVASSSGIEVVDQDGKVLWKYDVGGTMIDLAYAGRDTHLAFLATRKSMLDFRQQSVIGALADTGKLIWQYRSREVVTLLGHTSLNTNIIIGTGKRIHLYGPDGRARWSLSHAWGGDYLMGTLDGKQFVVLSAGGKIVQVRGE